MNLKFHETKNEENLLIMALHRPFTFYQSFVCNFNVAYPFQFWNKSIQATP